MSQTGSIRGLSADGESHHRGHPSGAHSEFVRYRDGETEGNKNGKLMGINITDTLISCDTVSLLPRREPSAERQPASQLLQIHLL